MFDAPAKSFLITEGRDPSLTARINQLAEEENLKPASCLKRFLDNTLPALKKKPASKKKAS